MDTVPISISVMTVRDGLGSTASFLCLLVWEAAFLSFLPTPLVLLTDAHGEQAVHIAPEAFNVTSLEFPDQIDIWEKALPESVEGLSSVGPAVPCIFSTLILYMSAFWS